MDAMDRRIVLRGILSVTVAAGCSATLMPGAAEAMPLALEKDPAKKMHDVTHRAQVVVVRPPGRPPPRRRRRRRWTCWWRRGRRICGYKWR